MMINVTKSASAADQHIPWKSFSWGKEWQILVLVDRKETIFYARMDWEQKHWGVCFLMLSTIGKHGLPSAYYMVIFFFIKKNYLNPLFT